MLMCFVYYKNQYQVAEIVTNYLLVFIDVMKLEEEKKLIMKQLMEAIILDFI